ncbi:hypothetical protein [Thalassolituus oleivorans]|uniref:hypothetical protein n=1 Tax=Thalassolituus oleivorans TaxID=187493 RepID=UPI0012DDF074|nr:hypothetical protein [Thalassolituus oleivorans]
MSYASASDSICHGTTSNGSLENGVQLPSEGNNFESYSNVARLAGRTYVHSSVYNIVVAAYSDFDAIVSAHGRLLESGAKEALTAEVRRIYK